MTGATAAALLQAVPQEVESPLPGGVATLVRFIFGVPQWIQIAGLVVGAVVVALIAVRVVRHRKVMATWVSTRRAGVQAVLWLSAAVLILGGVAFGAVSWDYMQHDNGFCTGCHVMGPAFTRFTESEHAELSCHDCHQQPITASMRQLYLWVAERPEEIGPHAPVPDRVCANCHNTPQPDSAWQRIAATAGHRLHLRSDSAALTDVQCVTCHGQEVHRFVPAEQTCGQSDCHAPAETRIALGAMSSEETAIHCVVCHEFTTPVAEFGAAGVAAEALVPQAESCLGCHEMQAMMAEFDAAADPHRGVCGTCHNPHEQETPEAASETCTSGGCHTDPETITPLHRGLHAGALDDCGSCHVAHTWEVQGTDCRSCHSEAELR